MRISYSDDEQYPGQFNLWQANCDRSLVGRKGQAALRELEAALVALPNKRLIADEFENEEGICPLAAVAKYRGLTRSDIKADPESEMEEVGVELGMPRLVAWKIVELNDIIIDGHYADTVGPVRYGGWRPRVFIPAMPEERYEKVLSWVRSRIVTEVG